MKTDLIDNRQIRIFISSTFRDMQDERNQLMRFTFPKLRDLAAKRDVTLRSTYVGASPMKIQNPEKL